MRIMDKRGMTLLELMMAMTLMTLVMGVLFGLTQSFGAASSHQQSLVQAAEESRKAIQFVAKELRQASVQSIDWSALPSDSIRYRVVTDADGNGSAVDANGNVELSTERYLGPDTDDFNDDGLTDTQLIMIEGATSRVIANSIAPIEDVNWNGVLDAGEDLNGNDYLEDGLRFAAQGNGLMVTVRAQVRSGAQGPQIPVTLAEFIRPRN